MKPDEIWYNGNRYIHESRVPISCGGTLEETTQDRLDKYSQAEFTDKILEIRKLRKRVAELEAKSVCHWTWNKEDSVFDTQCGNRAPFKERYCQYCGAALANALPSGRCSKHGAFVGSDCQECLKEICLTSGNAEIQCPIKDLCKPEFPAWSVQEAQAEIIRLQQEWNRYRAALEKIISGHPMVATVLIAKQALEGGNP
jgi:hypothetical protein